MTKNVKGSFTVEAAYLIPLILLILCLMSSLCLYVYQKSWASQAACEIAVFGSGQTKAENRDFNEAENRKWTDLKKECYIEPVSFAGDIQKDQRKIEVTIKGETFVPGREGIHFSVGCKQEIIRPESKIRKTEALFWEGE